MVKITGYAKKKEPRLLNALLAITALLLVAGAVYIVYSIATWVNSLVVLEPQPAEVKIPAVTVISREVEYLAPTKSRSAEVTVGKMVITSKVNDRNLPTDNLENVSISQGIVYCYTRINCPDVPATIRHVWVDSRGKVFAEIPLQISNRSADTWSYISLYGAKAGEWEVQVRKTDNSIVAEKKFIVYP